MPRHAAAAKWGEQENGFLRPDYFSTETAWLVISTVGSPLDMF